MSIARSTEILEAGYSPAGIKTLTLQESAFVSGKAFTHSDYTLNVLTGNITYYLFDPTACTCNQIVAEVPLFNASAGPITIEFFSDPTTTANGAELPTFNRRATSSIVAEAKLYIGPTITDNGTRFSGLLLAATAAAQGNTGESTVEGLPFEVDLTKKILIKVTNTNGDGVDIGRRFDWVEV